MAAVEIRLLKGNSEFKQCEEIQRAVWGGQSVSAEVIGLSQKYGGAALGALVKGRLVGFLYALLARRKGQLIHWSHMMALTPEFRDRGLGLRMKLAHRKVALQQGIKSICWTYDPLQSRNASLNLGKLGAGIDEYIVDCYGRFPSVIERGLPSDRFVANWRIGTQEVERRLARNKTSHLETLPPRINRTRINAQGFLENRKIDLQRREPRLLVEIPPNADLMRSAALPLAERWRHDARKIFMRYLARGYRVEDFVTATAEDSRRECFYLLRRQGSRRASRPKA